MSKDNVPELTDDLFKRTDLGNSFLNFIAKGMPEDNNNEDQKLVPPHKRD